MIGPGALIFARCAGFVSRAPGFSHPSVPPAVRAGCALAFALALLPAARGARVAGGTVFALALALEFGIGAAIGIAASVLYDGAYAGGRALDDYVGIRGSVPNAQLFAASGFGRIWSLALTAGFFLLGGYRYAVLVLARSFERVPAGGIPETHALYGFAFALPRAIVEAALLTCGPAIALAFAMQVTLGALARVVPRFASFTLSFPVVFGAALIATLAAVTALYQRAGVPWILAPWGP